MRFWTECKSVTINIPAHDLCFVLVPLEWRCTPSSPFLFPCVRTHRRVSKPCTWQCCSFLFSFFGIFIPNFPASLPRALSYSQDTKVIPKNQRLQGCPNETNHPFLHFCQNPSHFSCPLFLSTCLPNAVSLSDDVQACLFSSICIYDYAVLSLSLIKTTQQKDKMRNVVARMHNREWKMRDVAKRHGQSWVMVLSCKTCKQLWFYLKLQNSNSLWSSEEKNDLAVK